LRKCAYQAKVMKTFDSIKRIAVFTMTGIENWISGR
jgi:hypothetical protein